MFHNRHKGLSRDVSFARLDCVNFSADPKKIFNKNSSSRYKNFVAQISKINSKRYRKTKKKIL